MKPSFKKKEFKVIEVEGIAMWASVHQAKQPFVATNDKGKVNYPTFQLELIVDEANAKIFKDNGVNPTNVKVDDLTKKRKEYPEHPGKLVFTLRRTTHKQDGTEKLKLEVVDAAGNTIPETTMVGNGSKVAVRTNPYKNQYGTTSNELLGVQVLELVSFKKQNDAKTSSFTKRDGFVVSASAATPAVDTDSNEDPFI